MVIILKPKKFWSSPIRANVFFSENGFLPDFEFEDSDHRIPDLLPYDGWGRSGIQFSNTGDEVLLLDPWDEVVDQLVYGNATEGAFSEPPPAPKEGNSLERYPPERDRDRGGDWREREQISPGRLDRSPPTLPASLTPGATVTTTASLQPSATMTATVTPSSSSTIEGSDTPTPEVVFSPTLSQTPPFTLTPISTSIPAITLTSTLVPTPSEPGINTTRSGALCNPYGCLDACSCHSIHDTAASNTSHNPFSDQFSGSNTYTS